jgi:ELWxxDGT repeat protein
MAPVLLTGLALFAGCGVQPQTEDTSAPKATTPQRLEPTPWVQDLDTRPGLFPAAYESVTLSTGLTLLAAGDELHGVELWASDGTEAGTRLVKELDPGLAGESPGGFTDVQGTVYFTTSSGFSQGEALLWKTDGSSAGTVVVKRFPRVGEFDEDDLEGLTHVQGTVYFLYGNQLWKSDGTAAGTTLLRQLAPEDTSARLRLHSALGLLFFDSWSAGNSLQLWRTDGTTTGTVLLKDLLPVTAAWESPAPLVQMGNAVYFAAGPSLQELWKSDGTPGGTVLVANLGSRIQELSVTGSTLFIVRSGGLWKSDGTAAGTQQVRSLDWGWYSSRKLTPWNGAVYFALNSPESGNGLWRSDGTSAGTFQVKNLWSGPDSAAPHQLHVWKNHLYFLAMADAHTFGLWKSDGTAANTTVLQTWPAAREVDTRGDLLPMGNVLLARPNGQDGQTWRTDGTVAGTRQLGSVRAGSTRGSQSRQLPFTVIDRKVFFSTRQDSCGETLWRTDGTSVGTLALTQLRPPSCDPNMEPVIEAGARAGSTYFFEGSDDTHGDELWRSDGTSAGTFLLKDIFPGAESSRPYAFTELNGTMFFTANDGVHGWELWKSDGTVAGTVLFKDFHPGPESSYSGGGVVMGGVLYFKASDGIHGSQLWRTNGTAAGTVPVTPEGLSVGQPTVMNGHLFFYAEDGVSGPELWKSDGTAAGTVLVKDIHPGPQGSYVYANETLVVDGQLYFLADDGTSGRELWKSNGTQAGTVLVKDIVPGAASGMAFGLSRVSHGLVFAAYADAHGFELWKTDGTAAGTVRLTDLRPGPASGVRLSEDLPFWENDHDRRYFETLTLEDKGLVLFNGVDEVGGAEPWVTDGTPEGTTRLADVVPGPESSEPMSFARLDSDRVFFFAAHPTLGREPHVLSIAHLSSAHDDLGSALGTSLARGNTCGRSNKLSPTCGSSRAPDHLYRWTAPFTGTFTFTTAGSSYDTVLQLVDPASGTPLGCNDDSAGTLQSSVSVSLSAGQPVRLSVDGYGTACGSFALNIHGIAATKRGLTWVQNVSDSCGQTRVTCNDCDPYQGDTLCSESRPLLCIKQDASTNCGGAPTFSDGWTAATVQLTPFLVRGTQLYSLAEADALCARTFGTGYRMAEHHDGGGGWGWRAKGTLSPLSTPSSTHPRDVASNLPNRFWVRIKNQPANCWN